MIIPVKGPFGVVDALGNWKVHDISSVFAVKQCLLLVTKTLSYGFGIVGLRFGIQLGFYGLIWMTELMLEARYGLL